MKRIMPRETFQNLPDEKRRRILEVAIQEFADNGYVRTSVEAIARKAGVAKGSMYQYFESKQELYLYMLDLAGEMKLRYAQEDIGDFQALPLFDLLERLFLSTLRYARERPYLYRLYEDVQTGLPAEVRQAVDAKLARAGHEYYMALLSGAAARGEVRGDVDLEVMSVAVYGLIRGFSEFIAARLYELPEEHSQAMVRQFLALVHRGIAPEERGV